MDRLLVPSIVAISSRVVIRKSKTTGKDSVVANPGKDLNGQTHRSRPESRGKRLRRTVAGSVSAIDTSNLPDVGAPLIPSGPASEGNATANDIANSALGT